MKRAFLLSNIIIFAVITVFSQNVYADVPTLCKANEKVILSCPVKGNQRKIISICGKETSDINVLSYIEYRFGTKKNAELTYRVTKENKATMYRGLDKGTYSVFFGFQNYEYFYLIDVPQEEKDANVSVIIIKDKKAVANIDCVVNTWVEDKNITSPLLTEFKGDFLLDLFIK